MLGLIFSAIIGTMPEMLPHWREFPQWCWSWFLSASTTFLNYKKPVPTPPAAPQLKPPDSELKIG
jgi:hypothetical protein